MHIEGTEYLAIFKSKQDYYLEYTKGIKKKYPTDGVGRAKSKELVKLLAGILALKPTASLLIRKTTAAGYNDGKSYSMNISVLDLGKESSNTRPEYRKLGLLRCSIEDESVEFSDSQFKSESADDIVDSLPMLIPTVLYEHSHS